MSLPFSLLLPIYVKDAPEQFELAFTSSVIDQTLRPDEVVIVQDGPVAFELAAAVERLMAASPVPVRRVVLERNQGLAAALEIGLDACTHDVVARMDSDDVSMPERFARQLAVLADGYDLVGTGMFEFVDDPAETTGQRIPPTGRTTIERYARFHDPFNHPTVVYRKAAVRAAGGYQDLGLMEDYWLFGRMILAGARSENIADPLVRYRVGAGAYHRRGGFAQFRAEVRLQLGFRRLGFTSSAQFTRNLAVRGGYRFVPVGVRRVLYGRFIARGARRRRPL
jgi:glycosyltransferase involved in cell wall biosynthesis